ncbi:hypothetical protein AW863_RS10810 [Acinetobacter baumannii]|uniref:hypothetical protein n=1 Tax=Acinetobacter calcoaceticus/baumannii complex TaxID=909768 RepID=UPI000B436EEB|nr:MULTISPECIES: hypothetical protein [Acinetobacter calcoaceticus/baumannii complex]AVI32528.1 hypothetical protein CSB70_2475 [Acinetobacter baumannii]AVI38569.1 hypothetical protein CSB68_0772 [Acinetobacter baumannii]EHU1571097.1 hypothetical protein [Acinetobacter baumannii]EHU1626670.1 hypothetical protein [Acinetobacter baumannii]EHU1651130.1 hypothetical protein [Acinetobacter baumannii]
MSGFENLKIAITEDQPLNLVCDVLIEIGYSPINKYSIENYHKFVTTNIKGQITGWNLNLFSDKDFKPTSLSDLIKLRNKVKAESKEG